MAIVTKKPTVTPSPPSNVEAVQSTAEAAREAALAMLQNVKIDDSNAPIEAGEVKAKPQEEPAEDEVATDEKLADQPDNDEKPAENEEKDEKPADKQEDKKLSDPLKNSFERLAREKSDLRKAEEGLKAREAKVSKYEMVERAVANDDALGVLAALGVKYSTLVNQELAGGKATEQEDEPKDTFSAKAEARIAALEQRLAQEQNQRSHSEMQGRIAAAAKADTEKFPNVAADPSLSKDVVDQLLAFTMKAGHPPGETIEESIQMAMEAVEEREEAALQKLMKRRGLTGVKASDNTSPAGTKSAVEPAASELARKSKTLTNSHASTPRAVGSTPAETVEELRAKALKQLEALGG